MKILVLNGSPKREESGTLRITRAFLDGMREVSEQEVKILHVIDCSIAPCSGCFTCMVGGGTCVHRDDMRGILDEIVKSDLLIWSFPLYCYGMPAPLKALLDRTLPLSSMAMQKVGDRYAHVGQADLSHLCNAMICGCGFPNSRHNFEPAAAQFRLCFPGDPLILTVPECPLMNAPEAEIVTGPRLALVRDAGRQYAESGAVDASLIGEIGSPMIPEEDYAAIVNAGTERT
jgi:putative NADPH-quinone reductase